MSDETAVTTTAQTKKRFAGRAVTRSIFTALLGMSNWFVHRMRVPQGESPEPNERKIIDDSVALTEKHIEDRWAQNPPYHRGFHAKSNGVLQATFEVLPDLDDDLRQGVFAEPGRTYQTWIRYSNGAGLVQADSEMDTRGMAIKLMGVRGKKLGLISNADVMEVAAWDKSLIAGMFDTAVLSCRVGAAKPEPRIYEICLDRLGVTANEAVFVGDGGSSELRGAKAVGMTAVMIVGVIRELWPEKIEQRKPDADFVIEHLSELLSDREQTAGAEAKVT